MSARFIHPCLPLLLLSASVLHLHAGGTPNAWTNSAGDLLWSTPLNWSNNMVPYVSDSAQFDSGAGATNAPGSVNNIVDVDSGIQQLLYFPMAPAYHTTLIRPGVTLTVLDPSLTGDLMALRLNTAPETTMGQANITGRGRLIIGDLANPATKANAALIRINASSVLPGPYWATLDMSALDYFACAPAEIRVGANGSSAGTQGTWKLAKTNLLVVGSSTAAGTYVGMTIGHTSATGAGDYPSAGDVQLGQENILQAYSLRVGALRATNTSLGGPGGGVGDASRKGAGGTMEFQTGLVNPALKIRGFDGVSGMLNLLIGDNTGLAGLTGVTTTTNSAFGVLDLTGGTVDALIANLQLGRNNASTTATRGGDGIGILTWTSGTIEVTNLVRVGTQAGNNLGNAIGVLNVQSNAVLKSSGATFNVGGDTGTAAGIGMGTVNVVHGGVVMVAGDLAEGDGSGGNGTSSLNLTNGYVSTGGAITIDNINLASGVVSNTGLMTVSALSGNGTIGGSVSVNAGIAVSDGRLNIYGDLTLSPETTNMFRVNLDTLQAGEVVGINNAAIGGVLVLTSIGGKAAATNGAVLHLINASNFAGGFSAYELPSLSAGLAWDTGELGKGVLKITSASTPVGPPLSFQSNGSSVSLSWPSSQLGWYVQTNALGLQSPAAWHDVEGSQTATSAAFPIDPACKQLYFRLRSPQ